MPLCLIAAIVMIEDGLNRRKSLWSVSSLDLVLVDTGNSLEVSHSA